MDERRRSDSSDESETARLRGSVSYDQLPEAGAALGRLAPHPEGGAAASPPDDNPANRLITRFLQQQRERGERHLDYGAAVDLSQLPDLGPPARPKPHPRAAAHPPPPVLQQHSRALGSSGAVGESPREHRIHVGRGSEQQSGSPAGAGEKKREKKSPWDGLVAGLRKRRKPGNETEEEGEVPLAAASTGWAKARQAHLTRLGTTNARSRMDDPHPFELKRSGQLQRLASEREHGSRSVRGASGAVGGSVRSSPKGKEAGRRSGQLDKTIEEDEGDDETLAESEDLPAGFGRLQPDGWTFWVVVQWIILLMLIAAFVVTLVFPSIREDQWLTIPPWKWFILGLVIFCGRLISGWVMQIAVWIIERNYLMRKRVLYFVYGLRSSVQNTVWLGFVLLAWHLILDPRAERTKAEKDALNVISKILDCLFIAASIILIKTLAVKVMASRFHVRNFFERIQEGLFAQHVLEALSGPPIYEDEDQPMFEYEDFPFSQGEAPKRATDEGRLASGGLLGASKGAAGASGRRSGLLVDGKMRGREIPMMKVQRMRPDNVSAFNMRRMMRWVHTQGVTVSTAAAGGTLPTTLDTAVAAAQEDDDTKDSSIRSELEAKSAARTIFANVAKPGARNITEDDFARFLDGEELVRAWSLFEGAMDTGAITRKTLKKWVVGVYRERKALALSLSDSRTAVKKLNGILNVVTWILIIIIWMLRLGIATTHLLVLVSSQLLLVVFIFGNMAKTVFEACVFLFVMHPFDIGDRCIIDDKEFVVEEMNVLTTVFLSSDNSKVWIPNSALSTKPIYNYYRSPDQGDSFDFTVAASTATSLIAELKTRINGYFEAHRGSFHPAPVLVYQNLIDMDKLKLSLWFRHTANHHDASARYARRSELMTFLRDTMTELKIYCFDLPQSGIRLLDADGNALPPPLGPPRPGQPGVVS
eukprot:SM000031S11548  [mRNA]  locus=s31:249300:253819:- [translate_table: standard]